MTRRTAGAAVLVLAAAALEGCAYGAARWRDFTDIVSVGGSGGGGLGFRADATKLLALEAIAQKDEAFYGWKTRNYHWTESSYGIPFSFWRRPTIDDETPPEKRWYDLLTTSRSRTLFPARTGIEDERHVLFVFAGGRNLRPVEYADFRIGLSALIGGLEVTISPGEMADFLLGWFTIDIGRDDDVTFGEERQAPPKPER